MIIHVVSKNETVSSIARQYNTSANLIAMNNEINPNRLAVGQTLVILITNEVHIARRGETLYSIARDKGVSVYQLWRNNIWLNGRQHLLAGEHVVISYTNSPYHEISTLGYIYPFVDWRVFRQTLPYMNIIMPFTYGFTEEGELIGLNDLPFISLANDYGAEAYMHLSTLNREDRFSTELAAWLLTHPEIQEILIKNITETIIDRGYAGLDIDFEYIGGYAAEYVAFLERVKASLSPLGLGLIVAVSPKESADKKGSLYEGHDYVAIGKIADGVLVMTYEWGYAYSTPRAVAPANWVRTILDYAVSAIPNDKIYLGLPNYGYGWPLPWVEGQTRARSISNADAIQTAIRFGAEIFYDQTAETPYFNYIENETAHEVWFEDARSMQAKFNIIKEYGLKGGGYWNLMRSFPQNWLVQNALFAINR